MSSTDISQQRKQLHSERDRLQSAIEEQRQSEAEFFEDGEELSNDKAARMQEHSGNQAIQDLIDRINDVENDLSDLEIQEEQDAFEEENELELDDAFQKKSADGSSGGGGSPWNQEFFYGGDDDPIQVRRRRKRKKRATDFLSESEAKEDEPQRAKQVDFLDLLLPTPLQGVRTGDSRYKAVELALQHVGKLIGHSLDPQHLSQREGVSDPIRLPVEIGRFLEEHAGDELAQSLGTVAGGPLAALVSPQGGFSTAVGRIASLSICAEVAQGPVERTDPAVALSVHYDSWEESVAAAQKLSANGQLQAPQIAEAIVGRLSEAPTDAILPHPNPLGGAALNKILPAAIPFLPPSVIQPEPVAKETDELLAMLDEALAEFTGADPFAPPSPVLDITALQPALQSANQLLSALGRCQVEFAAATVAVCKVTPQAHTKQILLHCDTTLKQLARSVVQSGQQLERLQGHPSFMVSDRITQCLGALRNAYEALSALRTWTFSTLAASVEQDYES